MMVRNRAELATTVLRAAVLDVTEAGIERVVPRRVMPEAVKWDAAPRSLSVDKTIYSMPSEGRIFVVGGGKAAGAMAEELETVLGASNITDGVVTCNAPRSQYHTSRIRIIEAGHPIPDPKESQDEPSQEAMQLALMPPAVVNSPPAISLLS